MLVIAVLKEAYFSLGTSAADGGKTGSHRMLFAVY
jgi:hypothetical protein